jgi:hypothetical protein
MVVLPGVLGCRTLRRTVQVRLGTNPAVPRDELPGGTPILFALAALRSVPQAGSQFRGLATAIHEISGLAKFHVNGQFFSLSIFIISEYLTASSKLLSHYATLSSVVTRPLTWPSLRCAVIHSLLSLWP